MITRYFTDVDIITLYFCYFISFPYHDAAYAADIIAPRDFSRLLPRGRKDIARYAAMRISAPPIKMPPRCAPTSAAPMRTYLLFLHAPPALMIRHIAALPFTPFCDADYMLLVYLRLLMLRLLFRQRLRCLSPRY